MSPMTCPNCHQEGRDCWVTRCGEDELVSREDAAADLGDSERKGEIEEGLVAS